MEDQVRGDASERVDDAVWSWFSRALAWTLFRLPEDGFLVLSVGESRFSQFARGGEGLTCEIPSNACPTGRRQLSPADEAQLTAEGWAPPVEDDNPYNWSLEVPWPAPYEAYERTAASVARAMRDMLGLWWPLELTAEAWINGTERLPDVDALGLFGYPRLRALTPDQLREIVAAQEDLLAAAKHAAESDHKLCVLCGKDYLDSRGVEILVGVEDRPWPQRDRTVDLIGHAGPGHFVALDVILDVEDPDDIELEVHSIRGQRAEQGSGPYVEAMLRADPDLRVALANRPDLAAALARDDARIEYKLMVMDTREQLHVIDFRISGPSGIDPDRADRALRSTRSHGATCACRKSPGTVPLPLAGLLL
jgi:hypothetical protein